MLYEVITSAVAPPAGETAKPDNIANSVSAPQTANAAASVFSKAMTRNTNKSVRRYCSHAAVLDIETVPEELNPLRRFAAGA